MFPYVGCTNFAPRRRRRHRWLLVSGVQGFDMTGSTHLICHCLPVQLQSVISPSSIDSPQDGASTNRTGRRMAGRPFRSKSVPCRRLTRNKLPAHPLSTRPISKLQSALLDLESISPLQCLLKRCSKWNFDPFLLNYLSSGHPVMAVGLQLFQIQNLVTVFRLDWTRLMFCLNLIENGYFAKNPFHNAVHSADVAQAMNCFLQEKPVFEQLRNVDRLSCLLAAFGHDMYHPGLNQKFLEATNHCLCSLYNNISVLENFHWRCLISILKESKLLDHLPLDLWREVVRITELLILATDMQRQQEYLNEFKMFLRGARSSRVNPSSNVTLMQPLIPSLTTTVSPGHLDRQFLMQILIKCADISNPCRLWRYSQEWSYRASTEFFNQGDEERRLGLGVTSFCDRYNTTMPKIQSGFMEYVAQPLFTDWNRFMGTTLSATMLNNLRKNCHNWTTLLNTEVEMGAVESPRSHIPADRVTSKSTLHQMADFEVQKPDVLHRRRMSASVIHTMPYRDLSNVAHPPASPGRRRVSLPARMMTSTRWTVELNEERIFETESLSDLSSSCISLQPPSELNQLSSAPILISRITKAPQLADVPESSSSTASLENTSRSISETGVERPILAPMSIPDPPPGFLDRRSSRRHSAPATNLVNLSSCAMLEAQLGPLAHLGLAASLSTDSESDPPIAGSLPRRASLPVVGRQLELLRLAQQGNSIGSCSTASSNSEMCQVGAY